MSKISIASIREPIQEEMDTFEGFFRESIKSKVPLLNTVMNYILRRKGKQMRPMFVFLSAKLLGQTNESTYNAASFIELLHTATLIHDDVVDEANERRGFFSINALWKSKLAVLVGDYLLSKGLLLAVQRKEFDLLEITSEAVREMSEGELLQIEKARKLNVNEEIYFEIIRKKTATLIASCTASGAKSVGAPDDVVRKMHQFGEHVGIAFQLRDDLFDYEKKSITGKPTGNDLKEKKMTLPLIHVLNNSNGAKISSIKRKIKKVAKSPGKAKTIIDYVKENGGIQYAEEKMNEYKLKALAILDEFDDCQAKNSLIDLVEYTISRKR